MIRRIIPALAAALFALLFVFAPTSEARAEGFELDAGFGWYGQVDDGSDRQGFHFVISPGWRFNDLVGVYIDQGLGGLFHKPAHAKRMSWFAGHTVINAKFFLKAGPGELWGRVGIGAMYETCDYGDHESWGAFALKLGVGYTVDIWGNIGIGGNFDYLMGAFSKGDDDWVNHYLDLMLHLRFKF